MDDSRLSRKEFLRIGAGSAIGLVIGACTRPEAGPAHQDTSTAAGEVGRADTTAGMLPDTMPAGQRYVGGVENLKYNNPFGQKLAPVWIHGKKSFHLNLGATNTKPSFPIAEQYLVLYEDDYTSPTKTPADFMSMAKQIVGAPIFDTDPKDTNYSPIWHNNWVLVPRSYQANTLKSEEDVKKSGYRIASTPIWVN